MGYGKTVNENLSGEDIQSIPTKRAKICIFIHASLEGGGGGINTLAPTIKYLSENRMNVVVVTGPNVVENFASYLGKATWKCLPTLHRSIGPINDFKAFLDLWQFFRKEKFDLLHTKCAKAGVMGRIVGRLTGIPVIVHHVYGSLFNKVYSPFIRFINILLERFLSIFTDHYIFVGNDILQHFKNVKIRIKNSYSIVYPAMDLTAFDQVIENRDSNRKRKRAELGLTDKDFAIGMVARFVRGKRHDKALYVMKELKKSHPMAKLFLVGRGPLLQKISDMVKKMDLQDSVKVMGYRTDLEELMVSWDTGIFTSFGEGLPQVLAQYVLTGLPVVTFEVDGSKELIQEGKTGFIVPIGDTEAMADRIRFIIDNQEEMRTRINEYGGKLSQDWKMDRMNKKLYDIYQSLLSKHASISLD